MVESPCLMTQMEGSARATVESSRKRLAITKAERAEFLQMKRFMEMQDWCGPKLQAFPTLSQLPAGRAIFGLPDFLLRGQNTLVIRYPRDKLSLPRQLHGARRPLISRTDRTRNAGYGSLAGHCRV